MLQCVQLMHQLSAAWPHGCLGTEGAMGGWDQPIPAQHPEEESRAQSRSTRC